MSKTETVVEPCVVVKATKFGGSVWVESFDHNLHTANHRAERLNARHDGYDYHAEEVGRIVDSEAFSDAEHDRAAELLAEHRGDCPACGGDVRHDGETARCETCGWFDE